MMEEERIWVLRNVFLLLDVQFAFAFIRGMISEQSGKGTEFVDHLVVSLGEKAIPFINNMLKVEIQYAESAADLVRPTSVTGRMLTSFMQLHMYEYMKKVLSTPIAAVCKSAAFDLRTGVHEVQSLIDGFTDLIGPIFNSDSLCPVEVKSILKILQDTLDLSRLKNGLKIVTVLVMERGWCMAVSLPKTILPDSKQDSKSECPCSTPTNGVKDLDIDVKVYQRLQSLSKLLFDLARLNYENVPFSTLLKESNTTMIEYLANVCSNTDKGPHAITTTRTPQQIFSTRAYLDLLPSVNRAVLESSLSKYLAGDASKAQYQHCLDMYNIFKSVASDVGLHKSMLKENRTLSSRDIRRRENLQRAIKTGDLKEFITIATSPEGKNMLDSPFDDLSYPITAACVNRHTAIAKYLLLTCRVSVNVVDPSDMTPLAWACKNASEDIISYVFCGRPNADVNRSNKEGYTPLHFVLQHMSRHDALILTLIEKGANVNAQSAVGESILQHAIKYRCSYSIIQTFIANGADVNHRDTAGRTAYYWAEANDYEQVLKLLEQKGAIQPSIPLPRRGVLLDTCPCGPAVPVSQSGVCCSCGKSRVKEIPIDKTAQGFGIPWGLDQVKNELQGRSLEQRCEVLGRKAPNLHWITFHFGGKEFTAKAPPNAVGKFLLRRCQVDTSVSFAWERDVVYGLCFNLPPPTTPEGNPVGAERLDVWLDLESPIWLYDFDEYVHIYIKPVEKENTKPLEKDKKPQLFLKFLFPPHEKPLVLPVDHLRMPRSILSTTLTPYLPSSLAAEAHRLGMNRHTEMGTVLLNDQQPISTQNITNMDIIIVKIREAYELEFIDDPTKTILVEKNLPVSRVIDMLSQFLNMGAVAGKEELIAPLPQELHNAFVAEGIPIPAALLNIKEPTEPRPKLVATQSQYIENLPKNRPPPRTTSKTNPETSSRFNTIGWTTTSPSPGLFNKPGDIEINEAPNRPSGRSVIIPSSPNGNPGFPSTQMHDLTTPATASAPTFNAPISPMTAPAATPPSPSYVHGSSAPMFFTNPQSTPASPSQTPTSTTPTSNSSSLSSFNATFNLPFTSTIVSTITGMRKGGPSNSTLGSSSSSTGSSLLGSSTGSSSTSSIPSIEPTAYVKETVRSLAKIFRNVPMLLYESTPLTTYSLVANDFLEIGDRYIISPRDPALFSEKYTLALPPTLKRLRVKWVSPAAPDSDQLASSTNSLSAGGSLSVSLPMSSSSGGTKFERIESFGPARTSFAVKADGRALTANPHDICVRNEAKLVFLGYSGAGYATMRGWSRIVKTALIRQLQRIKSFNEKDPLRDLNKITEDKYMRPEICGVLKSEWKFRAEGDNKYVFRMHELVGKEEFLFSQQFLISPGCIYVLVFNLLQPKDDSIQSWLETILTRAREAPVIIVGTHSDSKEASKKANDVLDQMARRYCTKYPNIVGFTAVSSKNFKGMQKCAQLILRISREKGFVDSKLPVSYAILAKLLNLSRNEAHRVHCPPYIMWEHIKAIGDRMGLWDKKLKDAMQYCMDISGIVHFGLDSSSPLADLVFLDNQWLPALMNSVLRFKPANSEAMVQSSQLSQIWKSPYFPAYTHPLLIDLLSRFEVLFVQDKLHYLVPLLLPEEKPPMKEINVPAFEPPGGTQSERIFEFGSVPVGFFSRLIARLLGTFDSTLYWRNGIIVTPHQSLQDGNPNCRAILEYIPATYRLRMSVRNDKNGKLVRPLADSIMTFITNWFPGRLRRVLVTCAHCIANQSYDPYLFDLDECERAAAQGKQYVMCRGVHPVRIDLLALDVTLNDQSTIPYDQITLLEKLGEGSFAKVYRGKWGGNVVAVKVITMTDESTEIFREFRKEALLMSGLQHPNVVSLRGICLKPLCLVAEYLANVIRDLHTFLIDTTKPMNWPLRIRIARDIALGMEFLHCSTPPVVHRDLKSPNILLGWTKDKQVVAKVTDFGLSTRSNAGMVVRQVWNVSWLAPEIMRGHAYSTKVDVYSYGMVLWELCVRQKPFAEFDNIYKFDRELEEAVEKGLRPTMPEDCLPDYAELVRTCWADLPSTRPTFTDIIETLDKIEARRVAEGGETRMPVINMPATHEMSYESPTYSHDAPSKVSSGRSDVSSGPTDLPPIIIPEYDNAEEPDERPCKMLTHKYNAPHAPGTIQCMMALSAKGTNQVWAGCSDGTIIIIDANTRQRMSVIKHHTGRVYHMICINRAPGLEPMVWTASMDGTIVVLDTNNVTKPKVIKIDKQSPVTCLQEVGDSVWCGSLEGVLRIYDKQKYKLRKTLKSEGAAAIGCLFSPPGADTVWVGTDKYIWVMDAKNYGVIRGCEGHSSMINSIKRVNNTIWSCSADKTIRVWTMAGDELRVLQGHDGKVFCLLGVDNYVISGSWDASLFVWDANLMTFLYEVKGYHTDGIGSLVMVRDEVWSGSWDRTICIFTLEDKPR